MRHALQARAEELFRAVWGEPVRTGAKQWRARTSSAVSMEMRGDRRGLWYDHKSGEGGTLLDLIAVHVLGLQRAQQDFPRVLQEAARWCGLDVDAISDLSRAQEHRKARAQADETERKTEAKKRAALVADLQTRAMPIEGTPAAAYLANRKLTEIPASGLAYLPPTTRRAGIMHPHRHALVVWARDDAGRVVGGQRVLVMLDGSKAPEKQRKPSFGAIAGYPARFPARAPAADDAPVCIAEGPETALAIWHATGWETWAVFGATFFAKALLPLGRKVILCPDRDAAGSPAAKAFASAVEIQRGRGCDLWIAEAPEPEGSRRDLADTLVQAGSEAVREAVANARPVEPPLGPFYPARKGNRSEALKQHPAAIERFFRRAFPMVRAAKQIARGYAAIPEDLEPNERKRRQLMIRREAQERFGLSYLPTTKLQESQGAPRVMIGGAQGVGKTRTAVRQLLLARGLTILVLTTGHAKCAELVGDLVKEAALTSDLAPAILQLKGRGAFEGPEGMTMCLNPKVAAALGELGVSVPKTLCTRCPFESDCGYLAQEARLKRLASEEAGVIVVAPMDYAFVPLPGGVTPDLVVFDEAERNLGYLSAAISFDALGEPLTYDGPARRKGKKAEAAEAADAFAALLAVVRPVRIAIRDAFQESSLSALAALRRRGVDAAQLQRVLDALHDFEDRTIGDRLGREISAYGFAPLDGRSLDLDKRLLAVVEGHHDKGLRAFRRICEALLLEMVHGRNEPVAVLKSENINSPHLMAPPRQGVVAHLLRKPYFGRELPFLHLDGTGDHRMAEQLFGPLQLEWHPVERPAHVVQVVGRNFSRQSITGLDSRGEPLPWQQKDAARLRADLVAYCHARPGALVVATKRVVEVLQEAGLRNPVAHYGALRGRNAWEGLNSVIVIGREQPSPVTVEAIGRAYAARAGASFRSLGGAPWIRETRGIRMRDGSVTPQEVETHPDPWAARVLAQIREGEALQAIDRVRPHFKEADPVRVYLLSPLVLDVTVDRVEDWNAARHGGSRVERALASSVLPLSESEVARIRPDLWPNRKAAQRDADFQKLKANTKSDLCLGQTPKDKCSLEFVPGKRPAVVASYLRDTSGGRGGSRTVFRALIFSTTREAEDVLEAAVGPVVDFRIEAYSPDAEPRPSPTHEGQKRAVTVRLPVPIAVSTNLLGQPLRPTARAGPRG